MSGAEPLVIASLASSAAGAGASVYGATSGANNAEKAGAAQAGALKATKDAQLLAASEQSKAFEFEGAQGDLQSQRYRSAAAVDEAQRRTDLQSSLETIQTIRAGRGLDLDSPTGRAIAKGVTTTAESNILTSKNNYLLNSAQSELGAELSRRKARFALLAGDASAKAIDAQIGAAGAVTQSQIDASLIGGVKNVAGIGTDLFKTMKYGGTGFGTTPGGAP
jgi:hypothetical protein